jgi:hypothetical protein
MALLVLMCLSNPINWMVVIMLVTSWSRFRRSAHRKQTDPSRVARIGSGSPEAAATALMFLSTAYRPHHAFVAKAQIQQREDVDEDIDSGPDTPKKHFRRQLRRIRNGEDLERLILRLE